MGMHVDKFKSLKLPELHMSQGLLDKFQGVILHLTFKDLLIYCLEIFYSFFGHKQALNPAATWASRCVQNAVICRL